jgi:anti-sigma B factor antagonist
MVMFLGMSTEPVAGGVALVLSGELDISVTERVERELLRIESERPATLVLDLAGLEFIDSSGMRLVMQADQRARRDGRRLAVVPGEGTARRLLRILGLEPRLELVADRSSLEEPG